MMEIMERLKVPPNLITRHAATDHGTEPEEQIWKVPESIRYLQKPIVVNCTAFFDFSEHLPQLKKKKLSQSRETKRNYKNNNKK